VPEAGEIPKQSKFLENRHSSWPLYIYMDIFGTYFKDFEDLSSKYSTKENF